MAIWGLGDHARRNLIPAILDANFVSLTGLYTRMDSVRLDSAHSAQCKSYSNSEDMLADPDVDAVWLATPNGLHFDQVMAALRSGKHVIVEKTAFSSLRETDDAINLARSKNLVLMEALMYRFHPQFRALMEIVSSGDLGELLEVRASFGFPHLSPTDIRYRRDLAGGALNDAGAYPISAVRQLLPEAAGVDWARMFKKDPKGVDTAGAATMVDKRGSIGYASWRFGASYRSDIRVWCAEGHVIAARVFAKPTDIETTVDIFVNGKLAKELRVPASNHFVTMLESFANNIRRDDNESEIDELRYQAKVMHSIRAGTR